MWQTRYVFMLNLLTQMYTKGENYWSSFISFNSAVNDVDF